MNVDQDVAPSPVVVNGKSNANEKQEPGNIQKATKDGIVKDTSSSGAAVSTTITVAHPARDAEDPFDPFSHHLVLLSSKQTFIAITWALLSIAYLLFLIPVFIVMSHAAAIRVSLCTAMPVPPAFALLMVAYWFSKHRGHDVSPGFLFRYLFFGVVVLNTIVMIALTIVGFVTDQTTGGVYGRGNRRDVNQRMTMGLFLFGLGYEIVGVLLLVMEKRARKRYRIAIGQENTGKICWC